MEHVSGRVALVTGASRVIGRQTAVALACAGWDVAFTARTDVEGTGTVPPRQGAGSVTVEGSLATTARLVEEHGVRALPITMDLLDLGSVQAAAETALSQCGRVDLLVNNAIAVVGHPAIADAT